MDSDARQLSVCLATTQPVQAFATSRSIRLILVGMNYQDLRCVHAAILRESVCRHLAFYTRLRQRISKQRFPPGDFDADVESAWNAVHLLAVKLHYASIPSGVAVAPKE